MSLKRVVLGMAVVAAAMGGVAVPSAHAEPTKGNGSCTSGEYCTYQDLNYGPAIFDTTGSINRYSDWWYFNTGYSPNDRTSSVWNRGTSVLRVYQNTGYSGNVDCFQSGEATGSVASWAGSLGDNSASSHLISSTNC